jgi:leucyl-tRNA synthetase
MSSIPMTIIDQYGADAVRWFMLSDSRPSATCRGPEAASKALALCEPLVAPVR